MKAFSCVRVCGVCDLPLPLYVFVSSVYAKKSRGLEPTLAGHHSGGYYPSLGTSESERGAPHTTQEPQSEPGCSQADQGVWSPCRDSP